MIMKYIPKIKANIAIYTNKKTTNILDGTYNSVFKGRSMDFEDLREYVIGDNVKDIDYKASARCGKILVKEYKAEKKHNIMLILDTGIKMEGDTKKEEKKKDVSLMTAGTIAYIANKNGDYVGASFAKEFFKFNLEVNNIEKILTKYERNIENSENITIDNNLTNMLKTVNRHMIVFVITDLEGLDSIKEETLKRLTSKHDALFINISDAYLTGEKGYDIDRNAFVPKIIAFDPKLRELEELTRKEIFEKAKNKLKKYGARVEEIDSQKEILDKIIKLLERRKNASIS